MCWPRPRRTVHGWTPEIDPGRPVIPRRSAHHRQARRVGEDRHHANSIPAADGTHDFLLVFGVAAAAVGFVLMSCAVPPSPVMARPVSGRSASPMPADPSLAAADDHLTGDRSQPVGVTPIPVPFPDNSGDAAADQLPYAAGAATRVSKWSGAVAGGLRDRLDHRLRCWR